MDNRVINIGYSKKPMILYAVLASLVLDEEHELFAGVAHYSGKTEILGQSYGSCPQSSGTEMFYGLDSATGELLVWNPEEIEGFYNFDFDGEEEFSIRTLNPSLRFAWETYDELKERIVRYLATGE